MAEAKLDQKLKILDGTVPMLPPGLGLPAGQPVKVFVTFFIDETGHVRVPPVESAADPRLIAPVVGALGNWTFQPPQAGGKPALVFVGRAVPLAPAAKN